MIKNINVAKDFSPYPAGRYKSDGPWSGEKFRDEILLPVITNHTQAIIDLDGTRGYGSSFLEEAFGGLVRKGYSHEKVKALLKFKASDKSLIEEVISYIDEAKHE